MAEVRAKDVQIYKIWQARCQITGCDWVSELYGEYQLANADRIAHLEEHRAAAE